MDALVAKECFKCGETKPLSEFYKHPMMADGHVNKCKVCNKKDVSKNREDNIDYIRDYDRNRRKKCNVSEERWTELLRTEGEYHLLYKRKYPKKNVARNMVGNAVRDGKLIKQPCEVCGEVKVHGHHPDYDKPLEVVWLCPLHHFQWHAEHGEGLNGV